MLYQVGQYTIAEGAVASHSRDFGFFATLDCMRSSPNILYVQVIIGREVLVVLDTLLAGVQGILGSTETGMWTRSTHFAQRRLNRHVFATTTLNFSFATVIFRLFNSLGLALACFLAQQTTSLRPLGPQRRKGYQFRRLLGDLNVNTRRRREQKRAGRTSSSQEAWGAGFRRRPEWLGLTTCGCG